MVFKQHHFVLVHGAGHGAWCWVRVVAALEKAGHRATPVDLASAGENTDMADDITSLEEYSRPLEDLFKSFPDEEKVILVGHSIGGMTVARMSEIFAKKISVVVYLSAFMPAPGVDFNDVIENDPGFLPQTEGIPEQIIAYSKVEGGPTTSLSFPLERLKLSFYNCCSAEDVATGLDRCKRFPLATYLCRTVPTTKENYGSVPRVFVIAMQDDAITPETAHKMIALNPPNEVHEIDSDHSMFFSAVPDVERILVHTAAKYDS